jgi:hypothetical protein
VFFGKKEAGQESLECWKIGNFYHLYERTFSHFELVFGYNNALIRKGI